ncbi:DUF397 domain-containing protein [Streptomyces sp. NPDC051662]|uniref:DUF397 domain-containing protein n=1 Tax=Streptomyces sp. NPDC051662 TaxID=3154750 RepID=UPI00341D91C8
MSTEMNWHRSSFSGGDNNPNCVELASVDGQIKMRESDAPDTVVTTSPERLRAFLLGIKAGEFDHLI